MYTAHLISFDGTWLLVFSFPACDLRSRSDGANGCGHKRYGHPTEDE